MVFGFLYALIGSCPSSRECEVFVSITYVITCFLLAMALIVISRGHPAFEIKAVIPVNVGVERSSRLVIP